MHSSSRRLPGRTTLMALRKNKERKAKRAAELKKSKAKKEEVAAELARLEEDSKEEERRVEVKTVLGRLSFVFKTPRSPTRTGK